MHAADRLVGAPDMALVRDDAALVREGAHPIGVQRQNRGEFGEKAQFWCSPSMPSGVVARPAPEPWSEAVCSSGAAEEAEPSRRRRLRAALPHSRNGASAGRALRRSRKRRDASFASSTANISTIMSAKGTAPMPSILKKWRRKSGSSVHR